MDQKSRKKEHTHFFEDLEVQNDSLSDPELDTIQDTDPDPDSVNTIPTKYINMIIKRVALGMIIILLLWASMSYLDH